jgi:hypothetical protein
MANLDVIAMVVSVVSLVLCLIFLGTYCMNRMLDRNAG